MVQLVNVSSEFSRNQESGILSSAAYRQTFCKKHFELRGRKTGYYHKNLNLDFFYDHYNSVCEKLKGGGL